MKLASFILINACPHQSRSLEEASKYVAPGAGLLVDLVSSYAST